MFQLSGPREQRLGDPARWQRYQDSRDGLLFTGDACCAKPPTGTARRAPTTSAGAISAFRQLRADRPLQGHRPLGRDPAVLQRRHAHARSPKRTDVLLLGRQRASRRRRTTTPTCRSRRNSTCASAATSARFASAPRRRPQLDVTAASRRPSTRASCRGARASGSATTTRWRCPTTRARTTWTWAPSGRTRKAMFRAAYNGSWFNNQDDTLVWDNPLVLTIRRPPPGAAGWRCGRPTRCRRSARRLREVRAPDAAHRLARVRLGEQRRAAAAVHDQQRAAAVRAAARDAEAAAHDGRHEHQPGVAPGQRLAVQHAVPPLRLQQRHARDRDPPVHQLRHVGRRARPAVRAVRARPQHVRCRRHVDAASVSWRSPSATRTTTTATTIASSSRRTRTCCSSRPTRSASGG